MITHQRKEGGSHQPESRGREPKRKSFFPATVWKHGRERRSEGIFKAGGGREGGNWSGFYTGV